MSRIAVKRGISVSLALGFTGLMLTWLLQDGAGKALIEAISTADLRLLALAAVLAIVIQVIRAWRFSILASGHASLPSREMIGISTRLILLNFVLPFKLGELGFPLMMKRIFGTPLARSTGILIVSRLMDVGVVVAILVLTSAYLLDPHIIGWHAGVVAVAGLMIVVLPLIIIDWVPRLRRHVGGWPALQGVVEQLSHGAVMIGPLPRRGLAFLLTCLIWITHALIAYLTALSIQAGIGFMQMAMASAASNLAFALPINGIAGLGPPQAAWAGMLNLAGIAWTPAIATALLCHGLLLVTISIWGAIDYLREGVAPAHSSFGNGKCS